MRIYPLYSIFTALILTGAGLTGGISAMPRGAGDLVSITTLIRLTGIDTPVDTAWTLFHEILFYAFFALLLVRRWLGVAAMGLWFGLVALNLHYAPSGAGALPGRCSPPIISASCSASRPGMSRPGWIVPLPSPA